MDSKDRWNDFINRILVLTGVAVTLTVSLFFVVVFWRNETTSPPTALTPNAGDEVPKPGAGWLPPDISLVQDDQQRKSIEYGRELIAHTSKYLGPQGSVKAISNGLNCQNCHLDAGTKTFGNNYVAVAATYPKYRARSGSIESIEKRVNDCFERSLNGQPLDTTSEEMHAIVAYIKFIGSEVTPAKLPDGTGLKKIQLLDRPADPAEGRKVYEARCVACHGKGGEGIKQPDGSEYQFPPLWGDNSYNDGAGLYRLSNFANFAYSNMPLGATHDQPLLSVEEAWDIAAYVNSLPRPHKDISQDWPKIETKPFDHPFGPYTDPYPEAQHKFGPFKEIQSFYQKKDK